MCFELLAHINPFPFLLFFEVGIAFLHELDHVARLPSPLALLRITLERVMLVELGGVSVGSVASGSHGAGVGGRRLIKHPQNGVKVLLFLVLIREFLIFHVYQFCDYFIPLKSLLMITTTTTLMLSASI